MAKNSQIANKPIPVQPTEPPESLGLHLEVDHPQTGKIELVLSEQVALKLGPWLIALLGLIISAGGIWFWVNYLPHPAPTQPPTAEIQPQK